MGKRSFSLSRCFNFFKPNHLFSIYFVCIFLPVQAFTQVSFDFNLALLSRLSSKPEVIEFYESSGFKPIWMNASEEAFLRRFYLLDALRNSQFHGLPSREIEIENLLRMVKRASTSNDFGNIEAQLTKLFLSYASQVHTGLLNPHEIDPAIAHKVNYKNAKDFLRHLVISDPKEFFKKLPPQTKEYRSLLKGQQELIGVLRQGGWGKVIPEGKYKLGDRGEEIAALRNRLINQNFLEKNLSNVFDERLESAVKAFQKSHGLLSDGVVGSVTLSELNASAEDRLRAVMVALERERWQNKGIEENNDEIKRKVLVNLTDFTAKIIDKGTVIFETRAVVGANKESSRSPEFSAMLRHMVINPTWYVPRSITVKEYLPELQKDSTVHDYLTIFAPDGTIINRNSINFRMFDENTFPYEMKQLPSNSNALGRVKFMFPNRHNIYMHDTPQKHLFSKEKRTFSHGCIRLQKPFEFAYTLLASQSNDPETEFNSILESRKETALPLNDPIPVQIIYRTAVRLEEDRIGYRRDIYGRDLIIFLALKDAGVSIYNGQG